MARWGMVDKLDVETKMLACDVPAERMGKVDMPAVILMEERVDGEAETVRVTEQLRILHVGV